LFRRDVLFFPLLYAFPPPPLERFVTLFSRSASPLRPIDVVFSRISESPVEEGVPFFSLLLCFCSMSLQPFQKASKRAVTHCTLGRILQDSNPLSFPLIIHAPLVLRPGVVPKSSPFPFFPPVPFRCLVTTTPNVALFKGRQSPTFSLTLNPFQHLNLLSPFFSSCRCFCFFPLPFSHGCHRRAPDPIPPYFSHILRRAAHERPMSRSEQVSPYPSPPLPFSLPILHTTAFLLPLVQLPSSKASELLSSI